MQARLIKFGRHILIVAMVVGGVGWLLAWLVDVPARWPDHGRVDLAAVLTTEQLAEVDCLIAEIAADPGRFRVSADFGVSYPSKLMIDSWLRNTWIESQEGTQLNLRAELQRKVQIESSCSLGELLP
jgi:hypothetical protein